MNFAKYSTELFSQNISGLLLLLHILLIAESTSAPKYYSRSVDILVITETKLDDTFPLGQFYVDGFTMPYRLDRNRNGGGVIIYVREDIPSKILKKHKLPEDVEGMFV